jgi:hypothetical protein
VIDHNIIQKRLEYSFGISGAALSWLNSYLRNRTQRVAIDTTLSDEINFQYGVPQGSVLGPKLYCVFSKPIGEICRRHNMSHHCYADVKPLDSWNNISQRLESCLSDISTWMCGNMLKLNEDKTELIIFAPKHRVKDLSNCHLSIGGNIISSAECVNNLDVYFNETLSMTKQVSAVSKSRFYQIQNIGRIRQYITEDACRTLVCSLVTSRLDCGNALLYGLPTSVIQRLRVQNTAARMITRQKKSDHITPVLHSLHWLLVSYRCQTVNTNSCQAYLRL